jgi:hypothetical protein
MTAAGAAAIATDDGLEAVFEGLRAAGAGSERHLLVGHVRRGRDLLRSREAVHREEPFPTGLERVDAGLAGGLERGLVTEVVGTRSCGRFGLVISTLARATSGGHPATLVDLGDGLDPDVALRAGCALERILWVRPRKLREALAAAEIALGGGFPLVVLDLGPPPLVGTRGVETAWLRLRQACEKRRAALLVSTPYRVCGSVARRVLSLASRAPGANRRGGVWAGTGREPRLLVGLEANVWFERAATGPGTHRGGPPCPPVAPPCRGGHAVGRPRDVGAATGGRPHGDSFGVA